jgi:hypothetical protein
MAIPPPDTSTHDLLVPIMREGMLEYSLPGIEQIRAHRAREFSYVSDGAKRFENPDEYRVGLEGSLHSLRQTMIVEGRKDSDWGHEVNSNGSGV